MKPSDTDQTPIGIPSVADVTETNAPEPTQLSNRDRTVAKASLIMMAAILLSRVLGQFRDTVISALFGLNANTDVYRSAFALPDVLFFLIAGGALSSSFIPVFSSYLSKGEDEEAWKVFSVVATVMAIVLVVVIILCEIFARPLVGILRNGLTPQQLDQTAFLTRIVLPSQFAFFLGALMFATLYTRQHFLIPALGPNVYNLGIIIGGILLARFANAGITGFAIGALVGALIGNLVIPLIALRKLGIHYRWSLDIHHPGVKRVGQLMLPVILGLSLPGIYGLINGFHASYLKPGSISALDQANRLMQAPLGIFGQSLAIAVFPTLSLLAAQQNFTAYKSTLSRALRNVFFLTIPVSIALIIFSLDIVRVLFEHGKFKSADSSMTAIALIYYCVGISAWSLLAIIQRSFYAVQDTKTPVIIGTITTILFFPLSYYLAHRMDHSGLAFATSIAAVIQAVWLIWAFNRKIGGVGIGNLMLGFTKTLVAGAVMAVFCYYTRGQILHLAEHRHLTPFFVSVFVLLISGGLGTLIFLLMARLMKMEELSSAMQLLKRRKAVTNS
jgi:putative peptidoglycan lipid II flippase